MMHGYMPFNKENQLLVPFRTWRNNITGEAAAKLTELFDFNIPERWSIAHLYQAILNHEEHVKDISFITTLDGYVTWQLTGEKTTGIGDASGMFPIDEATHDYDATMLDKFADLPEVKQFDWNIKDLLPKVLVAGQTAGHLTAAGAKKLDPSACCSQVRFWHQVKATRELEWLLPMPFGSVLAIFQQALPHFRWLFWIKNSVRFIVISTW